MRTIIIVRLLPVEGDLSRLLNYSMDMRSWRPHFGGYLKALSGKGKLLRGRRGSVVQDISLKWNNGGKVCDQKAEDCSGTVLPDVSNSILSSIAFVADF